MMSEQALASAALVVDDDPFSQELLRSTLINLGFGPVTTSGDARSALGSLEGGDNVDLLLLDLHMPDVDGVRFMRHLAEMDRPQPKVVLISGERGRILNTAQSLGRSLGLQIEGALSKPVSVDSLRAVLMAANSRFTTEPRLQQSMITLSETELKAGILGKDSGNRPLLQFQPKISVRSGEIVSVETLARWQSREHGILGPEAFIPLAEQRGLISELTNRVYTDTIDQVSEWLKKDSDIKAAVNLSINSFQDVEFSKYLIEVARERGVSCQQLMFEVAESQATQITPDCLEALLSLRLQRFGLSIDDFGTGSSSLTHLKNIPFTELKIDREFVTGAVNDAGALSILEESINLARKLNMEVVAEGVETREDWRLVEELGCDYVQGYYCARPMDQEQLLVFMEKWSGPH